ncbi:DUF488 domain-containing protein [Microbacterium sp. YY-01]|uniref:DUF488 domain-containing protein n=1 Tax=Microbacterium sp. YY-01 TaxID=3421634 RepID=UPI003D166443
MDLNSKRAYDDAAASDGFRVLVDRLWPRGISKEDARIDLWAKEVAPSDELRKKLHADSDFWPEFQKKYRAELHGDSSSALHELVDTLRDKKTVTLVFSAHDTAHNNVVVLEQELRKLLG